MAISAVITADIVNSTRLSKSDEKKLLKALEEIFRDQKLEFYRGDSFQVYLKEASEAFMLTMRARSAALKLVPDLSVPHFDVRASIGIGEVHVPVRSLKTASGKAFVLSGRAFDELRAEQRFSIQCQEDHQAINEGFKVISLFADYLFGQLTTRQATVVSELLLGFSQFEVSRRLKRSQSTINKHTHASGWTQIDRLLTHYKNLIHLIPS
jgi:hypothetical protein